MYLPWKIFTEIKNLKEYKKEPQLGCIIYANKLTVKQIKELNENDTNQREVDFYLKMKEALTTKNLDFSSSSITRYANLLRLSLEELTEWTTHKRCFYVDKILQEDFKENDLPDVSLNIVKRMPYKTVYLELPGNNFHGILVSLFDKMGEEGAKYNLQGGLLCSVLYEDGNIRRFTIPFKDNAVIDAGDIFASSSDYHWIDYQFETGGKNVQFNTSFIAAEDILSEDDALRKYAEKEFLPFTYIVLNSLLYICSKEPDISDREKVEIRTYNPAKKRTEKSEIVKKEIAVKYVKRRKAEAIRYKAFPHEARHISKSYWRKAHWHLYWTGKGRTIPEVKWLEPTLCGVGENNDITVEVVN